MCRQNINSAMFMLLFSNKKENNFPLQTCAEGGMQSEYQTSKSENRQESRESMIRSS